MLFVSLFKPSRSVKSESGLKPYTRITPPSKNIYVEPIQCASKNPVNQTAVNDVLTQLISNN